MEGNFLRTLLAIAHIIISILLMGAVLIQQRKQGGFSGIFGGGTQADSGQWQRFTSMTKVTIILAAAFMITSVLLILIS